MPRPSTANRDQAAEPEVPPDPDADFGALAVLVAGFADPESDPPDDPPDDPPEDEPLSDEPPEADEVEDESLDEELEPASLEVPPGTVEDVPERESVR